MVCFVSGAICKCSKFSSSNYSEYPLDIKFNSIVIFTFSLIALNKIFKYAGTGHKFSFKFCDCTKHMKMLPCRFNQFIESSSDTHLLHFLCTYRSLSTSFKLQNIRLAGVNIPVYNPKVVSELLSRIKSLSLEIVQMPFKIRPWNVWWENW